MKPRIKLSELTPEQIQSFPKQVQDAISQKLLEKQRMFEAETQAGIDKIEQRGANETPSFANTAFTTFSDMATFGRGDEIKARGARILGMDGDEVLEDARRNLKRVENKGPIEAKIAGGALAMAAPFGALGKGAGMLSKTAPKLIQNIFKKGAEVAESRPLLTSAGIGAGGANLYATGSATQENPYNFWDFITATGTGAAAGPLGYKTAQGFSDLASSILNKFAPKQSAVIKDRLQSPLLNQEAQNMGELPSKALDTSKGGILTLTRGEQGIDEPKVANEMLRAQNKARNALLGDEATEKALALDAKRANEAKTALEKLGKEDDLFDSEAVLKELLDSEYEKVIQQENAAWTKARELGRDAFVKKDFVQDVLKGINETLNDEGLQSSIKRGLAPNAKAALADIKDLLKSGKDISYSDIMALRKSINNYDRGAQSNDIPAMRTIKKQFLSGLENLDNKSLINATEELINEHNSANNFTAEKFNRFLDKKSAKGVAEIVTTEAIAPERIAQIVFGSSKSLGKAKSSQVVDEILKAAGDQSERAMQLIKQGTTSRLIRDVFRDDEASFSFAKLETNIGKLIDDNPTMFKKIYNKDEQEMLKTLRADLNSMKKVYGKDVFNSSGSTYEGIRGVLNKFSEFLDRIPGSELGLSDAIRSIPKGMVRAKDRKAFEDSIRQTIEKELNKANAPVVIGGTMAGEQLVR